MNLLGILSGIHLFLYGTLQEKQRLVQEVLSRQDQIRKQQEARDALQSKIQAMEGKLLVGGTSIMDHTDQQERELEQRRLKLAEEKVIC